VADACTALGAHIATCCPIDDQADTVEEAAIDAAVAGIVGEAGRIDLLAVDGAGLFAHGLAQGGSGHAALRACMDAAWNATRATVNHAFLAPAVGGEQGAEHPGAGPAAARGGRIVYLAPAPDAGEYAAAACAGLENLARTLSTEWARHGVTTVTIAPGAGTAAGEVAALVAYLASPAGAYFSGCLLDLRGPQAPLKNEGNR
jgi:NAD(P)-dependent dehydrogenase (short-subunit alcohol dehydrogenase family)